ncbi:MAG TPA: two-component regulator propeller domain-containing protein, partial [Bacteroidota bacterium]|nr:two-component regulator propeller domain-containing protein [Bacteroidota bacterium]
SPNPENAKAISRGYEINTICRDAQGVLWIGGWECGLDRFDERTGVFTQYRHNPADRKSLMSNFVLDVFKDRNGTLWVGQYEGLSRYEPATDGFIHYVYDPDNPGSLGKGGIRVIFQDRSGILWFGTWGGVLSRYDEKKKTFVNFTPNPRDPRRLHGGGIYAIHEDRKGILWVGASDGLSRFDANSGTFVRYSETNGLPTNTIYGILEDQAGKLWLSTRKGVSRFDPQTETVKNFDATDGLQINEFCESSYAQGRDGEMFFGGSFGLQAFFPEQIREKHDAPPIALIDFRLFGKPVPVGSGSVLQKVINQTDSLILPYNVNSFSFEYAALNYAMPPKNQYRYMLEGFDTNWHYTGSKERLAVYTNLNAGKYVFRVQTENHDGAWSTPGKAIAIDIVGPYWQTWWFRALLVVILTAVVITGFRLRIRNIKKRSREFERLVLQRTAQLEAANKELEAFSYSVSHDLRTPLRGIDGFSQILLDEYQDKVDDQGKTYLQRIRNASQRMAQLIDDMLNLSRINRGEIYIEHVDLSAIAREIADDLCTSQPDRQVEITIQDGIHVQGDRRLLHDVLENLLGNAWKYTSKHPTAHIEFGVRRQDEKNVYFVRDDGAGFDMAHAQKLFGAFQRLHTITEFPGTGVGLAIVQRIIRKHGGTVWAEGEVEKGATFYFTLHSD